MVLKVRCGVDPVVPAARAATRLHSAGNAAICALRAARSLAMSGVLSAAMKPHPVRAVRDEKHIDLAEVVDHEAYLIDGGEPQSY